MILADKIIELRKKNGWSQEELAEQLGVSRQSISKWEGAQSVPDMNRIIKMSEVFGVSTDLLLKDELELEKPQERPATTALTATTDIPPRPVSMEEAAAFLAHKDESAARIALGVMMCILSPVVLILLAVCQEERVMAISENRAAGFGFLVLFLLIGGAVALFVISGIKGSRYEYFEKEVIDTAYGVDGMVRERREKFRHSYTVMLVLGIVLCVISAIPIFVGILLFGENEFVEGIGTAALLVIVAVGVFLIVRSCIIWGGFQMLLQEGEYTAEHKEESRRNDTLNTIYWGACTAIYLAVSFLTNEWHRTWIIWPVAGVTYGIVIAVVRALRKRS